MIGTNDSIPSGPDDSSDTSSDPLAFLGGSLLAGGPPQPGTTQQPGSPQPGPQQSQAAATDAASGAAVPPPVPGSEPQAGPIHTGAVPLVGPQYVSPIDHAYGIPQSAPVAGQSSSDQADLYAQLFGVAPPPRQISSSPSKRDALLDQVQAPPPRSPRTLKESGLALNQVCDLVLKQLYLHGKLLGVEIARNARLPFNVIDECLRFLKDDHCIEVTAGDVIGRVSYQFNLTELGRRRAKEAFDFCRYVGPAPVPLEVYVNQCRRQAVSGINCTPEALASAFVELIIQSQLLEQLGPAVCGGKSIFLYGPPGNGKSQIAKGLGRFLNQHGGEIYVPYAIQSENSIITVFDPSLHQTTDDEEVQALMGDSKRSETQHDITRLLHENHPDMRWRRVRRPVVVTGGELTLEMLDLRFNQSSNFYVAPVHVKANGGVFLIDDFGRQIVSPRDLLNRWILPLEERIDYVTLDTGKKFPVPFEQLIIFSTNLDPGDLVDDAFLRRIRHKVEIGAPSRELYTEIFSLCCEQRQIPYEPRAIDYLYASYYDQGRLPRSSDPRDLLEIVQSICRFRNQRLILTQELMAEATQRFFTEVSRLG